MDKKESHLQCKLPVPLQEMPSLPGFPKQSSLEAPSCLPRAATFWSESTVEGYPPAFLQEVGNLYWSWGRLWTPAFLHFGSPSTVGFYLFRLQPACILIFAWIIKEHRGPLQAVLWLGKAERSPEDFLLSHVSVASVLAMEGGSLAFLNSLLCRHVEEVLAENPAVRGALAVSLPTPVS